MQVELHSLKRRPFLTPLLMPLAMLAMAIALALWLFDARSSTVVIAVRHAETTATNSGVATGLSAAGQARAAALLAQLRNAKPDRGVDAIYVSQDAPSQQTAAPLAQTMGLAVNVVAGSDWASLSSRIARNHSGEVVLVVADAAGLGALLEGYADDKRYAANAQDVASLFVIAKSGLSKPAVIRLRY